MKNEKDKVGFIAGRGDYPLFLCKEAKKSGVKELVVVGFHEHISHALINTADYFHVLYVGQMKKMITFFKKHKVNQVVMGGQINPSKLYKGLRPDWAALRILASVKEKNAHTIFGAVCDYFAKNGITILPASTFIEDYLVKEGVLGDVKLTKSRESDAKYAFQLAKETSRLDIGQTCVVKGGTVLAIEGFEGTDKCIARGGELGFGEVTVAKVSKKNHDMRFDIPCVGLQTIDSLIKAKAKTLVVEAEKTLFFEKDKVFALCKKHNICLVGAKL